MTKIFHPWFLQDRRQLHQLDKGSGPPVWQVRNAFLEQEVSRDSRERAEGTSILGREAEGEAQRNIISKLSEERNLRDLHLKHDHMSTAQSQEEDDSIGYYWTIL